MNILVLLGVSIAIALGQIWTKPKWVPADFYYNDKRDRWKWTFIVLWIAWAAAIVWFVVLPILWRTL